MPSYSRRQPMMSGDAPRITGLNSFGQPFRGNKIRGVGAEERRVGLAYSRELSRGTGPLSTRHQDGSQGNFAERKIAEAQEVAQTANERRAQEAVERGRTKAFAATGPATAPKRPGQLIETGPGRSKWVSGDEMDAQEKARVEARKGTSYGGGMFGAAMRGVQKGMAAATSLRRVQDRNFSRARVALEKIHGRPMDKYAFSEGRESMRKSGELDQRIPEAEAVLTR